MRGRRGRRGLVSAPAPLGAEGPGLLIRRPLPVTFRAPAPSASRRAHGGFRIGKEPGDAAGLRLEGRRTGRNLKPRMPDRYGAGPRPCEGDRDACHHAGRWLAIGDDGSPAHRPRDRRPWRRGPFLRAGRHRPVAACTPPFGTPRNRNRIPFSTPRDLSPRKARAVSKR